MKALLYGSIAAAVFALIACGAITRSASPSCGALTVCGNDCADLSQHSGHCGSCGNDCGGGGCVDGACQRTVELAAGGVALTVNDTDVLWTDTSADRTSAGPIGGGVFKCAKSGCGHSATPVVQSNMWRDFGTLYFGSIAATTSHVYWIGDEGSVPHSCAVSGCSAASALGPPPTFGSFFTDIRTDGTNVFWASGYPSWPLPGGSGVVECPVSGCSGDPTMFSNVGTAYDRLVLDATNAYWLYVAMPSYDLSVLTCPLSGCVGPPRVVVDHMRGGGALAVDAINLYWVEEGLANGRILACALTVVGQAQTSCDGAHPVVLADGQSNPTSIASDGTNVYWTNLGSYGGVLDGGIVPPPGGVMKCAVGGCGGKPTYVANSERDPKVGALKLVLDAKSIYWIALTDLGKSSIMKTAK